MPPVVTSNEPALAELWAFLRNELRPRGRWITAWIACWTHSLGCSIRRRSRSYAASLRRETSPRAKASPTSRAASSAVSSANVTPCPVNGS